MRVFRSIPSTAARPVALTIGNFDGVHLGHREMLRRLRDAADARGLPAAVLTFEPHPREFFAPDQAPLRLTGLRDKLRLLSGCGVDEVYVCRFDYRLAQMLPEAFIERILVRGLAARWVLIGDDFRFGARRAGDAGTLRAAAERLAGTPAAFELDGLSSFLVDGLRVLHHPVPTKTNPLGAKGVGEAGVTGSMPCIMNAIADALRTAGVTHFDMPATQVRVWEALQAAKVGRPDALAAKFA